MFHNYLFFYHIFCLSQIGEDVNEDNSSQESTGVYCHYEFRKDDCTNIDFSDCLDFNQSLENWIDHIEQHHPCEIYQDQERDYQVRL